MVQGKKPRRANRIKRRVTARFECDGKTESGFVTNLSKVGLFIQTRKLLKVGSFVGIQLSDENGQPMDLTGKVAYSRQTIAMAALPSPGGMGIELTDPPEGYLRFVEGLEA